MPWKLIFFFIIAVLVLIFVGVNTQWTIVSFIFYETEAPVFLVILVSFLLGMLSLLPMVIMYRPRKLKQKAKDKEEAATAEGQPPAAEPIEAPKSEERKKKK